MEPSNGVLLVVVYAVGGVFVLAGQFMLTRRLENKLYSKILACAAVLAFLAVLPLGAVRSW